MNGAAGAKMLATLLAVVPLLAFASPAMGAAGEPDPTFGSRGFSVLDEPVAVNEFLNDVVVLPDGKILAAGERGGPSGFLLARFNPDGTPDISFGEEGIRVEPDTGKPGDPRAINAIEMRSDGKIVAAGFGQGEKADVFELARYRADGTLDPAFGTGGLTPVPIEPAGNAFAVAQAPDGRVVAAGDDGPGGKAVVVRVTEDGLPDAEFNAVPAGVRTVDVPGSLSEAAFAVRVLASGTVLLGGASENGPFLAELDVNGNPVAGFGENGIAVKDISEVPEHPYGEIEDMRVLPDGRILAAGATEAGANDFQLFVARFTPTGGLDPSFGEGGVLRLNPTPGDDEAFALSVLPDGRILTAGGRGETNVDPGDTWLVRLTPEGRLDPSFGNGGEATASAVAGDDAAFGLAIQPDGRAVVAGSAFDGSDKLLVGRFTADPPPAQERRRPRCAERKATLVGSGGADRIIGTRRADVIVTLGGNDRVNAAAGNDLVCAGAGKDVVRGGKGKDKVEGGAGPDSLFGAPGPDMLLGGAGIDLLAGGKGKPDRCNGGAGKRDRAGASCERAKRIP